MQRGGRGRGRRGGRGGGPGHNWQGGQDFQHGPPGGMGPGMMGGGMMGPPGPPMMGQGWDPMMGPPGGGMMGGPSGMMGGPGMGPGGPMMGGPGMMPGPPGMMPGGDMMGPPMDAGMPPPYGFMEGPMAKRMRPMDTMQQGGMPAGPMAGGQLPQQQQQPQPAQQQQQQRGGGGNQVWAGTGTANDYCQNFVDTGERPQNFMGENFVDDPLEGYPVQQELRDAKMAQVVEHHTPPYGIRADLKRLKLQQDTFGTRFDVILIDPPWEEYVRRAPGFAREQDKEAWRWQDIRELDVGAIADEPSFVFLWCGSEEGLDAGRHCIEKWGFRRIEDICWVKTNRRLYDGEPDRKYLTAQHQEPHSTLVHTKEHCLVGMKGKLNRTRDAAFVHANCDTDIILSEEPPLGSTEKPEELYGIIERFCNGRRRLELFGDDHNMRPGWVTVGKNISQTNFKPQTYTEHFKDKGGVVYTSHRGYPPQAGVPVLVPTTNVIEQHRPKSPTAVR